MSVMKLSTLLIIALLLALMASAPFAVAKNECKPHQCEWLQDPGADCGVKEYSTLVSTFWLPAAQCEESLGKMISLYKNSENDKRLISTFWLPAAQCDENSGNDKMVSIYKVVKTKCCANIHRCCDYLPCGETGCAMVPGSCRDNPGPQTCEELEAKYLVS